MADKGVISRGIELAYKTKEALDYTVLDNLQEIPEISTEAESLETTVLSDVAHTYCNGIKNYGDSLGFKFLYDKATFTTLNGLGDDVVDWKVTLPDGEACTFSGTASVKLDGVGVNAVLTYTLSVKPASEILWA